MLNLIISCGDPMERLLYGEPDPWLAQFECRHNHVPDMDGDGQITFIDEIAYEIQQQAQADPEGFLSSSGGGRDEDGFFFRQDDGSRQYVDPDSGAPATATDNDLDETDDLDRPRTRTERDVDAFLAQPAELAFDGDAEGWGLTSQDAFRADSERERPSGTEEEGDGEHDAVEALIVARGRALGLSEAQIARAITRYRASAVPLRAAAASGGLTNAATNPATALLGAGAHGDNTPSPASANPAELITRAGGSAEVVLGAAEGDRDSRAAGLDGIGETRDVPTINPAYMEWEERNKIPLYLKADGEPLAPNELSVRGWYPAKETYPEFAARHGVDVVLNPNYVEPGERPNQYLDGSGQPVPETWEQAVAAYEQDGEPLRQDAAQYETAADAYRTDFDAYEAAVHAWNENPGSAEELKALQDRRERLATEQARLSASADAINARAQARQAAAQNLNDLAQLDPDLRNSVIRTIAGPPELRETRYQEALDAHNDRRRVPRPMSEDANGEYIENYWSRYKAWESANNRAKIQLAMTAIASGRPVPDRLMVGGTYRTASLSDAATPVELAQLVKQWRENESGAERADDLDGGGGGGSSREYTVADDGTVSYTQDGHNYTVNDDDLAQDVREAATSGDASGLSSVDQVTVSTGDGGPLAAANYNIGGETAGGDYGDLRAAQETWFREQLTNLPDDPAEAAARLAELSARADELNAEWQGRDATFVGPDAQPITGAEYFAQVSDSLSAGANENAVIADRNAALPDAVAPVTTTFQPNAGLGDGFNADRSAIDARVAAANAIEDPAERAEALAALATDIRDLQEQWTGTDTQGWTLGVDHDNDPDTPRVPTTAPEWWGDYAASIETDADANRSAAEHTAASEQAVADFNSASSGGPRSPADYARLAEEWRNRPDNELVQIAIDDPALAEGGGVVYQTPSGYFARLSGDPNIIAAEEQRERERRILPGETGGIGTQVAIDPVTGTLQVSRGVMPLVQAQIEERERQERTLPGETGGIGTQALAIDPVTGTPQVSSGSMALVQAHREEQERQHRTLPGETGGIGTQVAVDPVTGTLQVSSGVAPIVQAQKEGQEHQQRFLPGETGGIGTQVAVDPVTGTLQVSSGVANALAAEAEQREIMGEGTLQVIRGDLNEPITIEDATHAIGRIFTTREEEAGEGTTEDGVALDAQSVRYQRSSSGGIYTPDEIRAAFPDLTDDQVKQQVALQAVLDIYNETQNPNIGSVQLTSELRRRGMDPTDAARYAKWTVDNGLGTYSDLWAVGGAVVGGVAGSYAGRWIPTFTARVSPRLTTGVLRGFAEETGEETGEIFAEVIATAVSGGNPVGILLDPSTYAYAGGSILFSGVTEADNPNARPRPEAVPSGAEGAGAVFSTTGSVVDPEVVAEGNRLLDRWSASNSEFNRYLNGSPPPGVDLATWNRRGAALARDVRSSGDALSQFRADNSGLVVGYSGGGGTVVVTADNSLAVVSPDGQASLYAYAPGDATFMMPSGGVDARTIFGIDDAGRLVPVGPETPGGAVDTVSGGSDVSVPLGSPDADDDPAVGFDATRGSPSSAQGNLGGTAAPPSQVAPVPTAALSEPLPLGQAEPAPQTTTPTPTEPKGQGDSRDGRSAPPGVRDPGGPSFTPPPSPPPSPQPSSAAQASPAPQPTPRTSPSPSITPTPNPDPGRGTQSQPGPGSPQGGTPGTLTQQTAPGTSPLTQPGPAPATQPIPVPTVGPQPFGTPSAVGQPTASDPTPANIPDVTPTPTPTTETQPGTQPQPEPSITPTITTTETPTITPTPRPRRRRRRGDDETPRRREIPNPVADDPNRHPREVQFVDRNLHTVDLVTGEHTIEPLDDEQLRTIHIRSFSPENPQGQVHLAGSVQLEVERQRIVAESADRRKDAGDPIDYRDINFVSGQGPARPSAQDLSGIQLRQSPGQLDYRDVNFVEGQGPSRSSARDLSRIQLPDQRNQGSGQQLDYRDINFVDREPSRSGSSGKSKSSGRGGKSTGGKSTGGKSGDGSNINYRPGQGPAPAANRRSANNADTGLMNGGGAAGRRRGGGRRRKDEDEDERGYRRPVIQVVLEG